MSQGNIEISKPMELYNEEEKSFNKQRSTQENTQDLDQEQSVTANPFQITTQNIKILVGDKKENYGGTIKGMTYTDRYNKIISNASIYLFFGNDTKIPVAKVKSDENGKFIINELPSGFYTIKARWDENYIYESHYIKLLQGEIVEHNIYVKNHN